ncbi:enoyl-CoA hydratase/isomerase family protein [Actinoplanes sp. CA-142083]|uniref:enoyl-CoA hydratase/isomerase family protein n=1 Tax=Actinoplanes sp. CA-142083 TaxID=3239903 RepID=UPI003D8FDAF1
MTAVQIDEHDGVTVVRMAHGKVNALDLDLLAELTAVFHEIRTDAVVLTGAGRAFSAGVDLWRLLDGGPDYVREFLPALNDAFLAVFGLGKPVVAAVNGHAIAGGAILAAACDHRVMAAGTIGVTEVRVGVPFPPTALSILAYAYGEPAARRAVLTGATMGPADALAAGYVDEVTTPEALLDTAIARARLAVPADTYRLTKAQLQAGVRERLTHERPLIDPQVLDLWLRGVEDGRIHRYMATVTGRGNAR